MDELDQFIELISTCDPNSMSLADQFTIGLAFMKMKEVVEPILLKYAATNPNVTNFLFKL